MSTISENNLLNQKSVVVDRVELSVKETNIIRRVAELNLRLNSLKQETFFTRDVKATKKLEIEREQLSSVLSASFPHINVDQYLTDLSNNKNLGDTDVGLLCEKIKLYKESCNTEVTN